jgi:uncharacterized membrane protein YgdD (TMEM256/DUF423 family)
MITPIGGIGFIVGWFVLAIASAPGEITRPIEP